VFQLRLRIIPVINVAQARYTKSIITLVAFYILPWSAKESKMLPARLARAGIAAPTRMDPTDPIPIKAKSFPVANRKSEQNPTVVWCSSIVGFAPMHCTYELLADAVAIFINNNYHDMNPNSN
jgi:hypothetical protein